MAVGVVRTYTCDSCGAKATGRSDKEKGSNWFKIQIKVFYGADKKDLTTGHVCNFKCAHDLMVSHPDFRSIIWTKMDELFH